MKCPADVWGVNLFGILFFSLFWARRCDALIPGSCVVITYHTSKQLKEKHMCGCNSQEADLDPL